MPTTDATYHNNAKYYAEQASGEKTSAQTARQGAETAATNAGQSATAAAESASQAAESARTLTIDTTLTQSGQAADAKKTGDEITGLKEDLSQITLLYKNVDDFISNKFIVTNGADGSTISLTPQLSNDWEYLIVDCVQGDRFYVDETGANTARAWAFIDANNVMLSKSDSGVVTTIITAPANASKVIFNNKKSVYTKSVSSVTGDDKIGRLSNEVQAMSKGFIDGNLFDVATITVGKYISPSSGNLNNLSGYNASEFIEIGAGNYVTVVNAFNAVIYKADKSFSREISRRYDDYPLTALLTNEEKYIRISVKDAYLSTAQVERNIGASAYVNYGQSVDSKNQMDNAYKLTTVYVGEGCCFTTINSALSIILDATAKNRYVLFITEGEYNETITTKDYVDIVGESKYKSIINYINDDESDYVNRSAVFASTYTTLKNLTVKTTGSKYPLHCDARYNEPYEVNCINCIFQHDGFSGSSQPAGTAVGIGLYWGQHVSLELCECIGSGTTGVASIYCHNSSESDAAHSRFRSLKVKDCVLTNATYGLRLQAIESNQLQANECVYIGNKNTANTPVSVEANAYQSWHMVSIGNTPEYTQS